MKKYHGKKVKDDEKINNLLAKATASLGGLNRRDNDWGIKRYEVLRVNRALERRIVITRWIIKELEENVEYEEDSEGYERGEGDDSEGDNVGRERGDWRECESYVRE